MAFNPRILSIFIGNPIFIIVAVYILYAKILSRNKTYISFILGLFYTSAIISLSLNIIYAIFGLFNEGEFDLIIIILYYITITLLYGAGIFLAVGCFLLYEKFNGKERDSKLLEILFIIIFFTLTIPSYFIFQGINIGAATDNKPEWDGIFALYYYIIFAVMVIIPIIYHIFKIRIFFKNNDLRLMKKWNYFIIGNFSLALGITMNFLSYTLPEFGTIFYIINAIGIVIGIILIGYSYSECKK
ncbi:MAG: hypothetical protein KGD63_08595 [Candidatus Lokiarchaeota archaeon]|nr:hypothetical protein [Candidatus Lokiarchaeota archaeon]